MKNEIIKIMREIIHCPNVEQYYNNKINTVCCDIIASQGVSKNSFQVPEPFSGEIDKANILIISSNPSIDLTRNEEFPTCKWDEKSTIEYFYNRFDKYITDGIRKRNKDGTYTHVPYWSGIKGRVKEVFELMDKKCIPGIDYCLTEIVHCKSCKEIGLVKAMEACNTYLSKIIKLSPASLFIIVGRPAQKLFCEHYKLEKYINRKVKVSDPENIEGKKRLLYFIPAPNAHGLKKMKLRLEDNEINKIKEWINNNFVWDMEHNGGKSAKCSLIGGAK